jgi:uncharacterized protein YlbG (UPF0298 family)
MNIESLENFTREINQIREYLKHIQYVNDVSAYAVLETDNEQIRNLLNTLKEHVEVLEQINEYLNIKRLLSHFMDC